MTYDVEVRAERVRLSVGRSMAIRFAVYGITIADDGTRTEALLEGGFFQRWRAEMAASEYLGDIAESAERAAGWDSNP